MTRDKSVRLFLDWRQRKLLAGAAPNIFARVKRSFEAAGWVIQIVPEGERLTAPPTDGYDLVVNQPVDQPQVLNLRNAYLPAFWRIEDSNDRWNFSVASAEYDPARVLQGTGQALLDRWRPMILKGATPRRDGFIFMPLQGVLQRQRHFQAMSPVAMIHATVQADPTRPVLATLHPKERYSDADRAVLADIAATNPRFTLSNEPSLDLLWRCDYVVSQNSSMAFTGFFAAKPAVLCARIDFHHIAQSVPAIGVQRAFARVQRPPPDFGRYLFWFLRHNAIAQFAEDAEDQIAARLRQLGWPL